MNRRRALQDVSAALQGRIATGADWMGLLQIANEALVTPTLYRELAISGAIRDAPSDAVNFMAEVAARNDDRNQRLRDMAAAAIAALNAADIEPTLMKGMAIWATSRPFGEAFPRMMSDVDLLVRPSEVERAISALLKAGFEPYETYPGPFVHVVAELARPNDVGLIDLHQRPSGPPGMAEAFDRDKHSTQTVWWGNVRIPSPAHQIYLMCLHDQLHDGDYWRGGFDLRHLLDIRELTRLPDGVDWEVFEGLLATRLLRNAVHAQLIAAQRIVGAAIPERITERQAARLHYNRHAAQHRHPGLALALAGLGMLLETPNLLQHRMADRAGRRRLLNSAPDDEHRLMQRPARLKHIMTKGAGKI